MAIVILFSLTVYASVVSETGGGDTFKIWRPERMRLALIALVVVGIAAYELRPGNPRVSVNEPTPEPPERDVKDEAADAPQVIEEPIPMTVLAEPAASVNRPAPEKVPNVRRLEPAASASPSASKMAGEEEYAQARRMPHQVVPSYHENNDRMYLDMLGRSAACGYPPALAKLGEYAVRRRAWVEAYYWTWRAWHAGMQELEPALKGIRHSWAADGYPSQSANVHRLFASKEGSIGRALLDVDSGRDKGLAKSYLLTNFPDFQ